MDLALRTTALIISNEEINIIKLNIFKNLVCKFKGQRVTKAIKRETKERRGRSLLWYIWG